MTKQSLMICPKVGYYSECVDCSHIKPHTKKFNCSEGPCPACIPVESKPKLCAKDGICKGDSCLHWGQTKEGYTCLLGILEPQPEQSLRQPSPFKGVPTIATNTTASPEPTCPDCGHPTRVHSGAIGCYAYNPSSLYCSCTRTFADLHESKMRYKCLGCGRDKFTRPNEPHTCNGQFRKHGLACIPVEPEPHKIAICEDCKLQIICAIKKIGKKECDLYQQEPEPTCPDCGCPISMHDDLGCHCLKVRGQLGVICSCKRTPADLQPEVVEKCDHTWIADEYPPKFYCSKCFIDKPEQPTPTEQMPLIEVIDRTGMNIAHEQSCLCHVCRRLRMQRDADMAWHNDVANQVGKAFVHTLEQLKAELAGQNRLYILLEFVDETIRAMAEEE